MYVCMYVCMYIYIYIYIDSLESIARKLRYTYSFVIPRITWKNRLGFIFLDLSFWGSSDRVGADGVGVKFPISQ